MPAPTDASSENILSERPPAKSLAFNQQNGRQTMQVMTALAVITALAAGLRFHQLGAKSLWLDEGVSVALCRMDWYNFARVLWRREMNMVLYYAMLRPWLHLGSSEAFIRTLSVIPSVGTVPLVYLLAKRLAGSAAGLAGASLLAVHAFHVRYAQEARSYSLLTFLITLSTLYFTRAVEEPSRRHWNRYAVATALAAYAHFFALLVPVAHFLSLKFLPRQQTAPRVEFMRAIRLMGILVLPLIIFVTTTGMGPIRWISKPTLWYLHIFLLSFTGNGGEVLLWAYAGCVLLGMAAAARVWIIRHRSLESWRYGVVFTWLLAPLVITLAVSLIRAMFLGRYMLICVPALALVAGIGIASIRPRWIAAPVLATLMFLGVQGVRAYYVKDFDIVRDDWRGAAQYVLSNAQAGDAIIFRNVLGRMPFDYYERRFPSTAAKPTVVFPYHSDWRAIMGSPTPELLVEISSQYRRVWVVFSGNITASGPDATSRMVKNTLAIRYPASQSRDFAGLQVLLYERQ